MTFAAMQPYLFPYGGYYELLDCVDVFVILDNVQFPRRGRVHRFQAQNHSGAVDWLTLPVVKASQKTRIMDMSIELTRWSDFTDQVRRYPRVVETLDRFPTLRSTLLDPMESLVDYLTSQICEVASLLKAETQILRASEALERLNEDYQSYICRLGCYLEQDTYVNPSGGRSLYDTTLFHKRGLKLRFMDPYDGSGLSVLDQVKLLTSRVRGWR